MNLIAYRTRRQPLPCDLATDIFTVLDPELIRREIPFRRMATFPPCHGKQSYVSLTIAQRTAFFLLDTVTDIISAQGIECSECGGFHLEIRRG